MGQAMTSETLSISGGDGYQYWVGLTMKPFTRGCKKTMYKGVLLGQGPRQWEKVVAKAFTDIPGTKEYWVHEVNKSDITKQLAAKFVLQCPGLCKIRVVLPGIVQMDKVSNLNKWLAGRKGKRSLDQDEWISIEELIPGDMVRYCPWTFEHHTEDYVESEHLQAFSHFTFMHTNGSLVACDFQGVCERKNSTPRYIFTDSTIHSRCKLYGLFDKGEYGITEFFKLHKCSNICKKWPKPTPLTPPPSFEEACAAQRLHLASAPTFENIVFPARSLSNIILDDEIHQVSPTTRQATGSRRRHQSDHQTRVHIIAQTERQTTISHRHRRRSSSLYDNVSCLTDTSNVSNESQPPAYDSLVATQERPTAFSLDHNRPPSLHDNTHGHHAVLSNSSSCPLLETAQGHHERPPRQALGRSATCDEVDSTRHSTPGLTFEESRVRSWSENVINPNLQQRRIMNLYACQREGGREQIVYLRGLQNELPPLIVPSAPRNPGEYLNDT